MWLVRMHVQAHVAQREKITDGYAWHRRIWDCFPDAPDLKRDFLSRIDQLEGTFRVWLLARNKPSQPSWCNTEDFELKHIAPAFFNHHYYAFDLRANPTKKLVVRDAQGHRRRQGKRIPLTNTEQLRAWLIRKGEARCLDPATNQPVPGGFRILEDRPLEISPMQEHLFRKKDHASWHGGVQFRGVLEVTRTEHFVETYQNGLGSAKGFGFGLLLLAPISL
jgi:CRISPR system Cascade subunit CasE